MDRLPKNNATIGHTRSMRMTTLRGKQSQHAVAHRIQLLTSTRRQYMHANALSRLDLAMRTYSRHTSAAQSGKTLCSARCTLKFHEPFVAAAPALITGVSLFFIFNTLRFRQLYLTQS
jgi:hypothetical protein